MSRIPAVLTLLLVCASGASAQNAHSPSLRIQPTSYHPLNIAVA